MEIRNRLFPYPVLCDETDDYNGATFEVSTNVTETLNTIRVKAYFRINDPAIIDLIRSGYAEYALHLECTTTSFRKLLRSDVSEITYEIPKAGVNREVAVLALIIAKRKIENFFSGSLNEDYQGTSILFEKASILAYRNMAKLRIVKNYEELAGNESIFSIVKVGLPDDDAIAPLRFDINDDRIKIMVDPKTYEAYIHFKQKPAIAMSLLVLPALVYMIDNISEDPESFSSKGWFIKMEKFYKAQGIDFVEYIRDQDKNLIEIAQEMLKAPIGTAYRNLMEIEA